MPRGVGPSCFQVSHVWSQSFRRGRKRGLPEDHTLPHGESGEHMGAWEGQHPLSLESCTSIQQMVDRVSLS